MKRGKDIYIGKGLSREEYLSHNARLGEFPALETDRMELLYWLMSVPGRTECYDSDRKETTTLGKVWSNHVLTVLADILHTDTESSGERFIRSIGTSDSTGMETSMRHRFDEWIRRLDGYVLGRWSTPGDRNADASVQAARSIRKLLDDALYGEGRPRFFAWNAQALAPSHTAWFRILQTLSNIQRRREGYIRMIEAGGRMDPALALLLAFIRNYGSTAERFNDMLRSLPEFYYKEILKTKGRNTVQDSAYLVVTPAGRNLFLPEGFAFTAGQNAAGEELLYRTTRSEQLTAGRIGRICSLFTDERDGRMRLLSHEVPVSENSEGVLLFRSRTATPVCSGWQLESRMFRFSEGRRRIGITFCSENPVGAPMPGIDKTAFTVEASTEKGWLPCALDEVADTGRGIRFTFTTDDATGILSPCTDEVHGTATGYPCIRILTSKGNYPKALTGAWAFNHIEITVEADGIRRFRLQNELGEIDTTQPFMPLGIAGEKGSWFKFGHEETDCLPLTEVSLHIRWDKLPQTPDGYAGIYRHYEGNRLTNASFRIATSYRTAEDWIACGGSPQPLFREEDGKPAEKGRIRFTFKDRLADTDRGRSFRAVLVSPEIGFGMEEYRRLFAEVMSWNGRNKKQREVPRQPVLPCFAETSLSYRATWSSREDSGLEVKLSRVTPLGDISPCRLPVSGENCPVVEDTGSDRNLYIRFAGFRSDRRIRMYADLAFLRKNIVADENSGAQENTPFPVLHWEYPDAGGWKELDAEDMFCEDTEGLTRNGYIEFRLPEELDIRSPFTLRARIEGDASQCLALKSVYLNCILVTAENGDGISIPAGTIRQPKQENARIASVLQPLPGFGGRQAESADTVSCRQDERIAHRNRAVAPKDFEQLILEQFPYIEKAHCLPQTGKTGRTVHIVVFSRTEGVPYLFTPAWQIAEIERWVSARVSPFVDVAVRNPEYLKIRIGCKAVLSQSVRDEGEVRRRLRRTIKDYFAAWIAEGGLPELGMRYSYKELHTKIANDSGVAKLLEISINGTVPEIDVTDIREENDFRIPGDGHPVWTVLIPEVRGLEFLPPMEGIDEAVIDSNFKIQ